MMAPIIQDEHGYIDPGAIFMVLQGLAASILVVTAWFVPKNWKGIKKWLSRHRASETPLDE